MSLQDDSPPVAESDASAPPPDLGEHAATLAREFRGLVHDHLELATLETRLCFHNLLKMTVITVFSALVLAGAWFALSGAAAYVLIDLGLAPALAMAALAAANLLVAAGGWLLFTRISARLGWPGIQRTLKPLPAKPLSA
jgi:hypothetical protein